MRCTKFHQFIAAEPCKICNHRVEIYLQVQHLKMLLDSIPTNFNGALHRIIPLWKHWSATECSQWKRFKRHAIRHIIGHFVTESGNLSQLLSLSAAPNNPPLENIGLQPNVANGNVLQDMQFVTKSGNSSRNRAIYPNKYHCPLHLKCY